MATMLQIQEVEVQPDQLFLDNGYEVLKEYSSGQYLYSKKVEYQGKLYYIQTSDFANTEPEYRYRPGDDIYGAWNFCLTEEPGGEPLVFEDWEEPWTKTGDNFTLTGEPMTLAELEKGYVQRTLDILAARKEALANN